MINVAYYSYCCDAYIFVLLIICFDQILIDIMCKSSKNKYT